MDMDTGPQYFIIVFDSTLHHLITTERTTVCIATVKTSDKNSIVKFQASN